MTPSTEIDDPGIQTAAEERVNALTHAIAGVLAVAALVSMVIYASIARDLLRIIAFSIYGSSLVLMYTASSTYHHFQSPIVKRRLKILDHSSIYLLISGTCTPIVLVALRGAWGWSLFSVIWGMAIAGVILKLFYIGRFEILSTAIYVLMGWLVLIGAKPLFHAIPPGGIILLFAGGLSYTGGVGFYLWERLPYNHAIWHLFVIAGSVFHFLAIWYFVLPVR